VPLGTWVGGGSITNDFEIRQANQVLLLITGIRGFSEYADSPGERYTMRWMAGSQKDLLLKTIIPFPSTAYAQTLRPIVAPSFVKTIKARNNGAAAITAKKDENPRKTNKSDRLLANKIRRRNYSQTEPDYRSVGRS